MTKSAPTTTKHKSNGPGGLESLTARNMVRMSQVL
jgi:hypothetical protein